MRLEAIPDPHRAPEQYRAWRRAIRRHDPVPPLFFLLVAFCGAAFGSAFTMLILNALDMVKP